MMVHPDKELAIHPKAVIPCPKNEFALARAMNCETCQHYNGLIRVGGEGSWARQYRVACAHPTARQMQMLEE